MIELSDSITISRSPSDVFAFVADLNNIPQWEAEVVTSKVLTPGPTRVGTRFAEEVKMGPTRATANCEVIEFVAGKLMRFKAASPAITYQGQVVVEPWQAGSKVTISGTVQPNGWRRLLQPLMKGEFRGGIKKELATLKTILENRPGSA